MPNQYKTTETAEINPMIGTPQKAPINDKYKFPGGNSASIDRAPMAQYMPSIPQGTPGSRGGPGSRSN